jgi:hypothetical protein
LIRFVIYDIAVVVKQLHAFYILCGDGGQS